MAASDIHGRRICGAWTAIGAEATASGYEVAWKLAARHQYTVWNTDANGNVTTQAERDVSGTSAALETLETSFHQDLNGERRWRTGRNQFPCRMLGFDGTGADRNQVLPRSGCRRHWPELKYDGTAFTAREWGGWTPIGAEATATGYEVAWKLGTDTYTVWNTDANGNITTDVNGVSGTSAALKTLETSFHQDLNGDGVIDSSSSIIEASGSLTVGLSPR